MLEPGMNEVKWPGANCPSSVDEPGAGQQIQEDLEAAMPCDTFVVAPNFQPAGVAELVDARDLKSYF
jgi:hypothetical protein